MARKQRKADGTFVKSRKWISNSVTDWDNETVDVGRVSVFFIVFGLVSVVIFSMLLFTGWDVIVNKQPFNPQALGLGVGGLLGGISTVLMGLGVYLFGDSRSRETIQAFSPTAVDPIQGMQNGTNETRQEFTTTTVAKAKTSTAITITEEAKDEAELGEGIPTEEIGGDRSGGGNQGTSEGSGRTGAF